MSRLTIPNEDTIAAIATQPGEGGIAVIRISGPKSTEIIWHIFKTGQLDSDNTSMESHRLYHGRVVDHRTNEVADEVLCVLMKSPNSYTGEDVMEIHSHGGYLVPKKILEILFSLGIRPANPGEFSMRAFLNGKMDLAQAEAVSDIINARTDEALKQAELQLEGALSQRIGGLRDTVLDMLAEVEAQVDFPEEDLDPIVKKSLIQRTNDLMGDLTSLLYTYEEGKLIKYGIRTAILGKPNVGKSSLLNRLLMKERAIVSHLPGTTRDFIEESIDVRGIPLVLTDTAGVRITADEIEQTGVEVAKRKAKEAQLLLIVLDGTGELETDDLEVLRQTDGKKSLIVVNKCDLELRLSKDTISSLETKNRVVHTSAKTGAGIEELKDTIKELLIGSESIHGGSEIIITELRHKLALENAGDAINSFLELVNRGESPEFLAIELRSALDSLGEITGEVTTEDILGRIFNKFCIGK
jgi:tRNA modification GTPase